MIIHMDRHLLSDDAEDILKRMTWYLNPARFDELYRAGKIDPDVVPVTIDGTPLQEVGGEEQGTYDLDLINKYFDDLDEQRETTGASLLGALVDDREWV